MKSFLSFLWEISKIIIIALVIVIPIRYFLFQPFIVKGASMEPNFHSGDYLIVDEISYRFGEPERGEVIVFKAPQSPSQRYIKRIIGLPGETITIKGSEITVSKDNKRQILDEGSYMPEISKVSDDFEVTLSNSEYFVMGDNRSYSYDSRQWGPLPRKFIIGKVFIKAWPLTSLARVATPVYQNP